MTKISTPMAPRPAVPARSVVMGAIFVIVFIGGFWSTLVSLHARWSAWTESYSHGYLLLGVAIYLYFDSERIAPRWLPNVRDISLTALAFVSLAWGIFALAGITILQQLSLPIAAIALLGALFDADRFWRALLPASLIFLGIPIWDDLLTPSLQFVSAAVAGWSVKHVFNIPTVMDGFHISIPAGTFEVAAGCAGLVFLLSGLTLGIVYGQLFLHRGRTRVIAAAVGAVLGIVVNWIRISALIVIGHVTDMKHPLVTQGHLLFGWYLFTGAMALAIFLSSKLQPYQPHHHQIAPKQPMPHVSARRFIYALVALLIGPLLIGVAHARAQKHAHKVEAIPGQLGNFLLQHSPMLNGFIAPRVNITYRDAVNTALTASLVYYPDSLGDGKLLSQSNKIWPAHARIVAQQLLPAQNGLPEIRETQVMIGQESHLAWSLYRIANATATTASAAKLEQFKQSLHGNLSGAYIHLDIICRSASCSSERQILSRQAPTMYSDISPLIEKLVE